MFKLLKYLKSFAISLVVVVALLFIQAQCELALPDYMSRIVNNGITSNGIANAVPEVIRSNEFDKVSVFLQETDKTLFLDNYKLLERSSLSDEDYSKYQKKYPILETESVYMINTKDSKVLDQLNTMLAKPLLVVRTLNSPEITNEIPELQQLPAGMSVYDALKMMPKEQSEQLLNKVTEEFASLSESNLNSAAIQVVKSEYVAIGVNLENFQNNYIFSMGGFMLLIALAGTVCAIIVGFLTARIAAGVSKKLRNEVFSKVENFSQAEFNKFSTASLITRTTNDIQQIQMALVMILRIVVYAPIIGFGALIKVLNTNLSMTWIIGLVIVVILSIMMVAFSVTMPKFKIVQKMVDRLNLIMREFLDGMLVIRAFNTQKHEEKIFDQANNDITSLNLFVNRVMVSIMPLMTFVMNSVALLIVYYGARQIDLGTLQIGDMLAFMQYSMQIIMSFLMISMISIMLPRAAVSANRVLEVLNTKAEIVDPKQPQSFNTDLKGVVEFRNVSFKYPGAEVNVLHNISLTAKPGETTAFIGSTGSGKSTIINLIPRFFDASEGQILVDGVNIRDVNQHELRDKIGFVPQKGVLFSGTIESNLKYADENATAQDLIDAAEVAQATDFINSKPEKFETEISQGGTNVSGGQKQRLSIARALVKKPEIYIFDDSFSALDFKTDSALRKALKVVTDKTKSTVFIVAQRISTIMGADQIVVLDKGEIAGIGTHDDLMANCTVYQEIAYSQLSKEELTHE